VKSFTSLTSLWMSVLGFAPLNLIAPSERKINLFYVFRQRYASVKVLNLLKSFSSSDVNDVSDVTF
jgi:hypothetical protein